MAWVEYLILFVAVVMVAVSGLYSILSAASVTKMKNYTTDKELEAAHKYLTIGAVLSTIGFVLILVIFGFMMKGGQSGSALIVIMIIITLGLALMTGILAAVGSSHIIKSPNYNSTTDHNAYQDANIAAIVSIAGVGIIFIFFIISLFIGHKGEKTEETKAAPSSSGGGFDVQGILQQVIGGGKGGAGTKSELGEVAKVVEKNPEILAA